MLNVFESADRLRKAYAADAVRQGLEPDGIYARNMYEMALEVFIAQMAKGNTTKTFEEHVEWYINQIEEQANGQG